MSTAVRFARRGTTIRFGPLSRRIGWRTVLLTLALWLLAAAVGVVACTLGEYELRLDDIAAILTGQREGLARKVLLEWRLPRVVAALAFGAALAVAGAIFQSLTHNPLGSPDVIGFNTGAYTGALVVITLTGGSFAMVAVGALAGGLLTALLVTVLAYRAGLAGLRLIITGIGIGAALSALNHWLVLRASLEVAMSAATWGAGSLNGIRWPQVVPALVGVVVAGVAVAAVAPRLRTLELGDDAAQALGVRADRTKVVLVVLGVVLVAMVTAVAGPIAFVALVAPQLARRLARTGSVALAPAAAMGALLLVTGDVIAQRVFAPVQLPVGVVTVCLGGGYLIWLLIREARR